MAATVIAVVFTCSLALLDELVHRDHIRLPGDHFFQQNAVHLLKSGILQIGFI